MSRQTITEEIAAPVLAVFVVLSNAEQFAAARPHVVRTEFVREQRTGIGTVFARDPEAARHEMTFERSVTEYQSDRKVRMVTESPEQSDASTRLGRTLPDGLRSRADRRSFRCVAPNFVT